jgi:hypothetical protein
MFKGVKYYKTETDSNSNPYNVYCKAEIYDYARFNCKPDDKKLNPPTAPV